jgi:Trk K+ transport system NAD-binding subunit
MTMAHSMSNHIVLVGLGRLGYRTFRLLSKLGEPVVVIEHDEKCVFLDDVRRAGAPLIMADARRDQVLIDANIAKARSIIIATNDDLANLEIALDSRRMQPRIRVVLRMFDQAMADKIRDGFNIKLSMSQAALAAPAFAMAAIDPSIVNTFVVDDELITMLRWTVRVEGPLGGKTVGEVMSEFHFGVVQRKPPSRAAELFPPPATPLEDGDEVLVQGPFEALLEMRRKALAPLVAGAASPSGR